MKQLLLCIVLSVLLSAPLVVSVEAASMWSRTYGGTGEDSACSVIATSDGGYAIAGTTNSFGSGSDDFWLVKIDTFGNMEWNKTYGRTGNEEAYSLVATSDGGYALAGGTWSSGAGNGDFWLVKTDAFGNMQWNQTYGDIGNDWAYSLVATSDGGYLLAGTCNYTYYFGFVSGFVWLVKTDFFGNMEWNRTYGAIWGDLKFSVIEASDGGYALTGSGYFLRKTDALGNMQWNITYGEEEIYCAYSAIETSDGGYAIAGLQIFTENSSTGWTLMKTDEFGSILWKKTMAWDSYSLDLSGWPLFHAFSLVPTSDGGYAIADYFGSTTAEDDFWFVKTDEFGNMQWNQTYGGTGSERAHSLVTTSDGGYAIAGYTTSFGAGNADFWLLKTDEFGVVPEYTSWLVPALVLTATAFVILNKKKLLGRSS